MQEHLEYDIYIIKILAGTYNNYSSSPLLNQYEVPSTEHCMRFVRGMSITRACMKKARSPEIRKVSKVVQDTSKLEIEIAANRSGVEPILRASVAVILSARFTQRHAVAH